MLLISVILGLVPLAGIAWTFMNGTIATVDGLFLTLILLTLSGILFLNAYLEARAKFSQAKADKPQTRKTN